MTETRVPKERELVLTREFKAPKELVWKAWTEPERLAQWWGPKGWKMGVAKLDLRPGGTFLYSMTAPAGSGLDGVMWGKFVYREIDPKDRIVFVNSFCDPEGNIVVHPMSDTWPREVHNTLTLEEHDGKTTVTLRGGPINATQAELDTFEAGRPGMQQGFAGTWQQLDEYLASIQ